MTKNSTILHKKNVNHCKKLRINKFNLKSYQMEHKFSFRGTCVCARGRVVLEKAF